MAQIPQPYREISYDEGDLREWLTDNGFDPNALCSAMSINESYMNPAFESNVPPEHKEAIKQLFDVLPEVEEDGDERWITVR